LKLAQGCVIVSHPERAYQNMYAKSETYDDPASRPEAPIVLVKMRFVGPARAGRPWLDNSRTTAAQKHPWRAIDVRVCVPYETHTTRTWRDPAAI